jgi:hypothetical protein
LARVDARGEIGDENFEPLDLGVGPSLP